jgi:hypothetical protein
MSEQNKTLVRRVIEEVYNQGNLAVADELAASNLLIHMTFPGDPRARGREAVCRRAACGLPRPPYDD